MRNRPTQKQALRALAITFSSGVIWALSEVIYQTQSDHDETCASYQHSKIRELTAKGLFALSLIGCCAIGWRSRPRNSGTPITIFPTPPSEAGSLVFSETTFGNTSSEEEKSFKDNSSDDGSLGYSV